MEYRSLTNRRATAITPQIVTVIVDDSGSMRETASGGGRQSSDHKHQLCSQGLRDMVISLQSGNQNSRGSRFAVNIAKFGTEIQEIVCAASPDDVLLSQLDLNGGMGGTEMIHALNWAHRAVNIALTKVRAIANYAEARSPTPLVVFMSDGDNNGPDISEAAERLKSIRFGDDRTIDIVAAGIGMDAKDFKVMEAIASRSSLAANIEPACLSEFIAGIGATVLAGAPAEEVATKFL
jgi:uncharacterized protein YegL